MNDESDGRWSPYRLYIVSAIVVAAITMAATLWWASSLSGSVRTPEALDIPAPQVPEAPRRAYVPPESEQRYPLGFGQSAATVEVSPRSSASEPTQETSSEALAPEPAQAPQSAARKHNEDLSDMFPMESVSTPSGQGAGPRAPTGPSFRYDGRTWTHTGKFADGGQVRVVPLGISVGGRDVYALANSRTRHQVLFVDRSDGSGRMAIYRSATR